MPLHVVVVDRRADFPWAAPDRLVVPAREFVVEGPPTAGLGPGDQPVPRPELPQPRLLLLAAGGGAWPEGHPIGRGHARPALEAPAAHCPAPGQRTGRPHLSRRSDEQPPFTVTVFFGEPDDIRLAVAARRIFELFRCPLLGVDLRHKNGWAIDSIEPISIREIRSEQRPAFVTALDRYTRTAWRNQRQAAPRAGRSPSCTIRRKSCRRPTPRRWSVSSAPAPSSAATSS